MLLAHQAAMDVNILLKTVLLVHLDMLNLDQSVKKDAYLINSLMLINKNVFLAIQAVQLALPSTIAQLVLTQPLLLVVAFALVALILAQLAIKQEFALTALVDSTTSKDHVKLLAQVDHLHTMEFADATLELFLTVNVLLAVLLDPPQLLENVNLAILTVLNAQETSTPALSVSLDGPLMPILKDVSHQLNALTVKKPITASVRTFATQDSSIMKEFASTEDASLDMLITDSEDVPVNLELQQLHSHHQVLLVQLVNSY